MYEIGASVDYTATNLPRSCEPLGLSVAKACSTQVESSIVESSR